MTRKPKPVLDIPPSPNLTFERALWEDDKQWIAGLDEAGRGAWAGPVVAAVVIFPQFANLEQNLWGVRDSKQMNVRQREFWVEIVREHALAWGVGSAEHSEIDQLGYFTCHPAGHATRIGTIICNPGSPADRCTSITKPGNATDSLNQRRSTQPEHRRCINPGKNYPGCFDAPGR